TALEGNVLADGLGQRILVLDRLDIDAAGFNATRHGGQDHSLLGDEGGIGGGCRATTAARHPADQNSGAPAGVGAETGAGIGATGGGMCAAGAAGTGAGAGTGATGAAAAAPPPSAS